MDQQTNQVAQIMTTMMIMAMTLGLAKPIMLQEEVIPYSVALDNARRWAQKHASTSADAAIALTYINAVPEAKQRAMRVGTSEVEAERTQLIYVLSNLGSWRGPEARSSKAAIKKRIKNLGGAI